MTENGEMVDVMGNGDAFDGKHSVRSVMHPACVVWFHLERIEKCFFVTICDQVVREAFVAILNNHNHDISSIA